MEQTALEEFNHWWIKGSVDKTLALEFKRDIYSEIERKLLNQKFVISLTGLRRIGKTTIMYQLIQTLIDKGIKSDSILFFSFDEISVRLKEVIETYINIHNKDFREERIYIFLDEIQKCENWENELKKYYDLYPKLKFVISGSESLFVKKKTKETLAGRIFEFVLSTFTFREYLKLNGVSNKEFKYETLISPFFDKFVRRGGFPETFNLDDRDFREYVRSLVVDKIVFKDIPKLFRIDDPEFLRTLLELIATNPGMYIDYFSLSKQFGRDRRVIKDYIFYLKESFLITLLGNYRKGSAPSLRKLKRAYPTDNALTYLYKNAIDNSFFGKMVETVAVNKLRADSFWKNGGEVDIVHNQFPIEVKYQERINSEDVKPIKEFMLKFGRDKGVVITKHDERGIESEGFKIKLIPAWKGLLFDRSEGY